MNKGCCHYKYHLFERIVNNVITNDTCLEGVNHEVFRKEVRPWRNRRRRTQPRSNANFHLRTLSINRNAGEICKVSQEVRDTNFLLLRHFLISSHALVLSLKLPLIISIFHAFAGVNKQLPVTFLFPMEGMQFQRRRALEARLRCRCYSLDEGLRKALEGWSVSPPKVLRLPWGTISNASVDMTVC